MDVGCSFALEKRLAWLRYAYDREAMRQYKKASSDTARYLLYYGSTFYMDEHFCGLVDSARATVPDDLKFEPEWMQAKNGFIWLEKPFLLPELRPEGITDDPEHPVDPEALKKIALSAVAWCVLDDETRKHANQKRLETGEPQLPPGSVQFMAFIDLGVLRGARTMDGFGIWSFFTLRPGDTVLNRTRSFEDSQYSEDHVDFGPSTSGNSLYVRGIDRTEKLHEVRWVFTAMHLMAQKLATHRDQPAERGIRRRWEREQVPLQPAIRVITLRRLEERVAAAHSGPVDWSCQWLVGAGAGGFWRNQWYPATQEHKRIWVEEFVKGPPDKPFRSAPITIYRAAR